MSWPTPSPPPRPDGSRSPRRGSAAPGRMPSAPASSTPPSQRLGVLQLDSVNVFERSHYLPLFARLGPYDKALLDKLTFARRGPYREYWAHEAALVPLDDWPLFRLAHGTTTATTSRPRRRRLARRPPPRRSTWLRAELAAKGPLPASKIERDAERARRRGWWGWDRRQARPRAHVPRRRGRLRAGAPTSSASTPCPSRCMPPELLEREVPRAGRRARLMRTRARAHGIGTLSDLADYFRLQDGRREARAAATRRRGRGAAR